MPEWMTGQAGLLIGVVCKAGLMYVVALLALRLTHRRTISQWSA